MVPELSEALRTRRNSHLSARSQTDSVFRNGAGGVAKRPFSIL